MSSEDKPIGFDSYWQNWEAGVKPGSTTLHPDVIELLNARTPGIYLDVGCGEGRLRSQIPEAHRLVGIDPNPHAILDAVSHGYPNTEYLVARGEALPFENEAFDGGFLMGVLGAVSKSTRQSIVAEARRCMKIDGILYIAEFSVIEDPEIRTSFGKRWIDVYKDDLNETGEAGTVIVRNPDGSPRFLAHHFTQEEITDLLVGFQNVNSRKVQVVSGVSGLIRDNWNIWAFRAEENPTL